MQFLTTIEQLIRWGFDHSENLYWLANIMFLVRKETKKDTKKEEGTTASKQMVPSETENTNVKL